MPILSFQGFKPLLHPSTYISPTSTIIGKTSIGSNSSIWFSSILRGDGPGITIGNSTNIQDLTMIHTTTPSSSTIIGDRVTVGHSCLLHACNVKDDGFVGMGSILLDNSIVESFGFVAAGSLVISNTIVKGGELWAGRPAKFIRKLKHEDLEMMEWTWRHYVELSRAYMKEPSMLLGTKEGKDEKECVPSLEEVIKWNKGKI